jgi:selenocysteine-specific elongation factor
MLKDLILGTAGHIDHGKTSLIGALTGTNTDRLPEEKKRGITIELGYAHLDLPPFRLGIVDVPGHEKFVRQMLAGATGMDVALLVIAGDDSIKQQTTEHLDILRMLDLPAGVIALTKCDLVDDDWLELVEEEIRGLVADSFLKDAPIIRTSSKTGEGLDELKEALTQACQVVASTDRAMLANAPFRMAIDRAFTIEGHGTVVTGSVSSGTLNVGDQLEIQPGDIAVRVRGIQNHDQSADSVARGQRAAINLAGIKQGQVERGHELANSGHLISSKLLTVDLNILDQVKKPFKDRTRIRFHVGTAELFGNVRLLDKDQIEPGDSGLAQVYLSEPTVTVWNQPFVVRRQSPVETIGGGRILQPNAVRIRKPDRTDLQMIGNLKQEAPITRAAASIYLANDINWKPAELHRAAGIVDVDSIADQLLHDQIIRMIPISTSRSITVHRDRFQQFGQRVMKTLERLHHDHPLRFTHARPVFDAEFTYLNQTELLNAVVDDLKKQKKVNANVNSIGLVGYGPKLSKGQRQLLDSLVSQLKEAGLKAPTVADLVKSASKNKDSVAELLAMAVENGDLVQLNSDYFLHSEVIENVKTKIADAPDVSSGLTMSEIRDLLDTSRKYAVPLCEYLDGIGFTQRDGDVRRLAATRD